MISVAIGSFYRWNYKNRAEILNLLMNEDINGVELTLGSIEELYHFKLTKKQISWLKKKPLVSIHAPFKLVRGASDEKEIDYQLKLMKNIYNKVGANNVIIHPTDIPPIKLLKKYNMKYSTENLSKRFHYPIPILKKIIKKYNMGLCLDVGHAYSFSKEECSNLIKAFKKNITQIHFHGVYKRKDHIPLRNVTKDYIYSLRDLNKLNVPIIIEENFDKGDINGFKRELRDVKEYLKSINYF